MSMLKRKKLTNSEDEVALEKVMDKRKIKKLDKIYIIIACVLVFGWLTWNLSGLKISSDDFSFITDYYSNWKDAKSQTNLKSNSQFDSAIYNGYLYYYDSELTGIYRMKTDGTQNSRVLKDNVQSFIMSDGKLFYTDLSGALKEAEPGGTPVVIKDSSQLITYTRDGNYIYYLTGNGAGLGIDRIGINDKNDQKVVDGSTFEFVPYGNYIYYIEAKGYQINKVKKSGGKTQIVVKDFKDESLSELGVYKGWLYYLKKQDLYKCRIDGTGEIKLQENVLNYSIENDILYVCTTNSAVTSIVNNLNFNTELYSMNLDGSNKRLLDKENTYTSYFQNGIAVIHDSSGRPLLKDIKTGKTITIPEPQMIISADDLKNRDLEDNNVHKIPETGVNNSQIIKIKNDIYYADQMQQGQIFKMNEEDGNMTKVSSEKANKLDSIGNLLIFSEIQSNNLYLYCMNDDGTGLEKVFDFPINGFQATEDEIYFTSRTNYLYRVQFSDNRVLRISNDQIRFFQIYNGYIYYTNFNDNSLYRIKEDGTSKEKLIGAQGDGLINLNGFSGRMDNFRIAKGYIYFYGQPENKNAGIYEYKIEDKTTSLAAEATYNFMVDDKYLYYQDAVYGKIYRCDLNGNNRIEMNSSAYPLYFDGDNVYINNNSGLVKMNIKDIEVKGNN